MSKLTNPEFISNIQALAMDVMRDYKVGLTDNLSLSLDDMMYHFINMDKHLQGGGDLFDHCTSSNPELETIAQKILLQVFSYVTQCSTK